MSDTQKKTTSPRKTNATKAKEANAKEKVTQDETEVSTSPGQEGVANASPEDQVAAQVSDESREDRIEAEEQEAEDNRAALTGDEDSDAYADQDPFQNAEFLRPRGVVRTDGTPQETYESLRKNVGLFDRKGVDPGAEGPAVPSRVYRTDK